MMTTTPTHSEKPENPLLNILFNIIVPIVILNKGSQLLGSVVALAVALAFPLGYGLYDYYKRRKANAISILGLVNVLVTGSLAIFQIHGFWFAVKEAAFPLLVGLFVFGSAFTKNPFVATLFLNPQLVQVDRLRARLAERNNEAAFQRLLKNATMWISLSFVFSAVCNFILALRIFGPIDETLAKEAQSVILNEQIAKMHTWAMGVIVVPSMVFLIIVFFALSRSMQKLSGLTEEEILVQK
jgi:hypothetical protein